MSKPKFEHYDLELIEPDFSSPLTDLIIELDHLRKMELKGSTHPQVFFQLKRIFHMLESIGSARIEGNNTTIAEYIETKIEQPKNVSEDIKEIKNIELAMEFIEDHIKDYPINRSFVSEIHKMIVEDLNPQKEGDRHPGEYRRINVSISNSLHLPPDCSMIDEYMNKLFEFINHVDSQKYDLLKVAIAHHRFVWIHPFANGNGRTVRLFTYAMLVKLGFNVNQGRILNPTAVFCGNRDDYYRNLAEADKGKKNSLLIWCEYVLKGLKDEIEKIYKLSNYDYLRNEILAPSIEYSLKRQYITEIESKILKKVVEQQVIQASNLEDIYPGKQPSEISRQIKKLKDKKMLSSENENTRKYVIRFDNNYLLRGIITTLASKGFLPIKDEIVD